MEENIQSIKFEHRAEQSTMALFLRWLVVDSTLHVVKTWLFFLKFGMAVFSVPLSLRTFWYPWRRTMMGIPKGFDPKVLFESLFGNIMSRAIGMILRTFFIALGVIFDAFIFFFGLAALVLWVAAPFLSLYMIWAGAKIYLLGHV